MLYINSFGSVLRSKFSIHTTGHNHLKYVYSIIVLLVYHLSTNPCFFISWKSCHVAVVISWKHVL